MQAATAPDFAARRTTIAAGGFFQASLPARIILAAFPLVSIPVAVVVLLAKSQGVMFAYVWLFGTSHFVLTLAIYLQSENIKHFSATRRNIALFIVVPLAIFCSFYLMTVLRLNSRFPTFAVVLGCMLRLADFNHLNRQTFGVFQLFKARSGLRSSASAKRIENGYFVCLTAMLFSTYLAGGVFPFLQRDRAPMVPLWFAKSLTMASLIVAAPLVSWMLMRLLKSWRDAGRPEGLSETIAYLGVQSVSVVFSIFSFPLYAATLAIHYVEYHVLMFPRCLKSELNPNSTLDGWYRAFRSNRLVFYLVVMVLSGVVTVFRGITMSDSLPEPRKYLALVAIFDGLFVFHYFIEAFIWRFQDPFFRRTTAPLYFTPRVASS